MFGERCGGVDSTERGLVWPWGCCHHRHCGQAEICRPDRAQSSSGEVTLGSCLLTLLWLIEWFLEPIVIRSQQPRLPLLHALTVSGCEFILCMDCLGALRAVTIHEALLSWVYWGFNFPSLRINWPKPISESVSHWPGPPDAASPRPSQEFLRELGRQDPRQARPLQRLSGASLLAWFIPVGPSEWMTAPWLRGGRGSEMALPIL